MKIVWLAVGFVSLVLGGIGAAVPLMPAFPFLLLAAISFAKSSERIHTWFVGTKLYKHNLESYVKGRGMTRKAKLRLCAAVTLTMGIGFLVMHRVPVGRIILGFVWMFHILYFSFGVRTIAETSDEPDEAEPATAETAPLPVISDDGSKVKRHQENEEHYEQ